MDTPPTVQVASEKDREYFRRLGEWERENQEMRLREHLALPLEKRIRASWQFCRQVIRSVKKDPRDDNPGAFYEQAKRLGLYRP